MQVSEIRRYLQNQMKMTTVDIKDPDAIIEGGDVLFTGKYLILNTRCYLIPLYKGPTI
jgi:hypothetical protein